jgi:putative transposase
MCRFSIRNSARVATLDRICWQTGYPKTTRVDRGSGFVSRDMDVWACQCGVIPDFCRPVKPTETALIEAFSARFRAEFPNAHWFLTLADAVEKLKPWPSCCIDERPHGAIGNKVPIMHKKSGCATSPSPRA